MNIHRRQFVIGPRPVARESEWRHVALSNGLHLSHCPSLPRASVRDRDGVTWHLLGLAAQTDPDRPDPIEDLNRSRTADVRDRYHAWAGRWALVGNGELHMDASGLLGCFYGSPADAAAAGEPWASSSGALLADLLRCDTGDTDIGRIRHGSMNWYPPPMSRYRSIRRLLPSQILILSTGGLRGRRLLPDASVKEGYDTILDALQESLVSALRRMARPEQTVWVPLSAGYDSRLVLALALNANLPVKTYTMRKTNAWRVSATDVPVTSPVLGADMTLPPLIAHDVGVEHRWISRGRFTREKLELFDRHTGGHTVENDRVYFSHGQWDWTGPSDVILRGGAFEVGHCFYWQKFSESLPPGALPDAEVITGRFALDGDSSHARGIAAWLAWAAEAPPVRIDWRDRLYIEQRIAGWLSSLEQALDLIPAERFYAVNSARIFALLTAIPETQRLARAHHVDLIARMEPRLLRQPFNPPDPYYRTVAFRAMARLGRLL